MAEQDIKTTKNCKMKFITRGDIKGKNIVKVTKSSWTNYDVIILPNPENGKVDTSKAIYYIS